MKKTYTIELIRDDKETTITRKNEGFTAIELIGILETIKSDLLDLFRKNMSDNIDKTIKKSKKPKAKLI